MERFPFTQDQLGSINGSGVDQLIEIVFHCCDSMCIDILTHTRARAHTRTHIHTRAFVQLWCNADVNTHVMICMLKKQTKVL